MLFGTSTGLYIYDSRKHEPVPFPGAEMLANKVICGIVEDRQGDLWISTTMGIWQYQSQQGRFEGYIHGNGLVSREYVGGVAMHTADDRVWFGISDGITSFEPDALRSSHYQQSTVSLTGVYIGGNAVNGSTLSDGVSVIHGALADNDRIELSYLDNTLSMEFSLLNYANPGSVVYEYRLNGAEGWTRTAAGSNVVMFHHLQPGSYVIEVRALDNGVYTESKVYHIIVRAPWYKSSWAYLIYILGVLGLIGLIG